ILEPFNRKNRRERTRWGEAPDGPAFFLQPLAFVVPPSALPKFPDSNQNEVVTTSPFDLKARAHQAMLEAGFQPDFPAEVAREVQALNQAAPKNAAPAARDLRSLLWSSIDNDSSRDLDQV